MSKIEKTGEEQNAGNDDNCYEIDRINFTPKLHHKVAMDNFHFAAKGQEKNDGGEKKCCETSHVHHCNHGLNKSSSEVYKANSDEEGPCKFDNDDASLSKLEGEEDNDEDDDSYVTEDSEHCPFYDATEDLPNSYQGAWPTSYRQSIDMLSSIVPPSVSSILSGSSLARIGSSFMRGGSTLDPEAVPSLTKPLISHASMQDSSVLPPVLQRPSSSIFLKSNYIELPPSTQCTSTQAAINGINVLCGVGILTTPYAIKEGGWLGLLLLFFLGIISCYTGILLKKCMDSSSNIQTYPDIGQAAFGTIGRLGISIVLYLELYASCVEFITLLSDSLSSIFPAAHVDLIGVSLSSRHLFAVMSALTILPTVWLKNLSLLSYLSGGGMIASLVVIVCLFWVGIVDKVGFHRGGTALDLSNLPVALGLYSFCYSGHSVFPNIYSSMKQRSHFPLILIICFITCTIMYAGVAVSGFLMFGESTMSQFTLNMPRHYIFSKIAMWTTVVNPFTKYALTMTPVALSLEELLPRNKQSYLIGVSIRTVLVLSTVVVAIKFPYFGFVMALLGSVFTMLVALILPCVCFLSIWRNSVRSWEIFLCSVIIFMGVACSCIGSYTSIKRLVNPT